MIGAKEQRIRIIGIYAMGQLSNAQRTPIKRKIFQQDKTFLISKYFRV